MQEQKQPIRRELYQRRSENLQDNTHAKVWFQYRCKTTLLKSHLRMGV